ncbi:MAG: hypothetical protein H7246_06965 [Phycisphaerae bacterium]|nr:hypothetical protein [Saprospiraceae bacterium]
MSKSKNTKPAPKPTPKTSTEAKDLKKVSLHVNEFGEIVRDIKTEDINAFLDKNVPDKKFLESDETMKR